MSQGDDILGPIVLAAGLGTAYILFSSNTSSTGLAFLDKYPGTDSAAFASAVQSMAQQLGISANDLMLIMYNETKGTFSPSIKGPGANPPVGLIQFEPGTAIGLGTTTSALAAMTWQQQLPYVQKYFQNVIAQYGTPNTTTDSYLAVFYPAYMNQDPFTSFPDDVVSANPSLFKSGNTIADFSSAIKSIIPSGLSSQFPNM
jgi:hypothetical protein